MRHILKAITMTEISAVDKPAGDGAPLAIMKRKEPDMPSRANFDDAVVLIQKRDGITKTQAISARRQRGRKGIGRPSSLNIVSNIKRAPALRPGLLYRCQL